jgi:hypothetical protein
MTFDEFARRHCYCNNLNPHHSAVIPVTAITGGVSQSVSWFMAGYTSGFSLVQRAAHDVYRLAVVTSFRFCHVGYCHMSFSITGLQYIQREL